MNKLMIKKFNYNTTRVYENYTCDKNYGTTKNQKKKILEKIISNILSQNLSSDNNIYNFIKLKKYNSSRNLRIHDKYSINNIDLDKENYDKKEILSASKIGEGNKKNFSNNSKCANIMKINKDKASCKLISDENSKFNETKDFDSKTKNSECVSTNNNTDFNSIHLQSEKFINRHSNDKIYAYDTIKTNSNEGFLEKIKNRFSKKYTISKFEHAKQEDVFDENVEYNNQDSFLENHIQDCPIKVSSNKVDLKNLDLISETNKNKSDLITESYEPNKNMIEPLNELQLNLTDDKIFDYIQDNNAFSMHKRNSNKEKGDNNINTYVNTCQTIDLKGTSSVIVEDEIKKSKNALKSSENGLSKNYKKINLLNNFIQKTNYYKNNHKTPKKISKNLLSSSGKKKNSLKNTETSGVKLSSNANFKVINNTLIDKSDLNSLLFLTKENQEQVSMLNKKERKISLLNKKFPNTNFKNKLKQPDINQGKKNSHSNKNLPNQKFGQSNSLKFNNYYNKASKNLSENDWTLKTDFLNLTKSSEIFLNNSKLSIEKENLLFNFKKNLPIINKKNTSNTNDEENFNSVINENYLFTDRNESDIYSFNKSIKTEFEHKAITNRNPIAKNTRLNNSPLQDKFFKSKSKNKMNVKRTPRKLLEKRKNLKIVINPIYEFNMNENKVNLEKSTKTCKNSLKYSKKGSNNDKIPDEASDKIIICKASNKHEKFELTKNIDINENYNIVNNPITVKNPKKKNGIFDFVSEESLCMNKKNSQTPINQIEYDNKKIIKLETNNTLSNKNRGSIDLKKFNYVFGDGNSTTNKNSFIKTQSDFYNCRNLNRNNSFIDKNNAINQQNSKSREMDNAKKKINYDGDFTNLKGRIKKI